MNVGYGLEKGAPQYKLAPPEKRRIIPL